MRLLDQDNLTGIKTYHDYDEASDTTFIHTTQDIQPILDANKARQNEAFDKRSTMWHAATIPAVIQLEWIVKYGIDLMNKDHIEGVKRLLNSSDYKYLRRNEFKL